MILITRPETDPFFNIAAEEFFLRYSLEDIVMVWQNSPSVVVGKHQNTFAEVNLDYVQANKIPVNRKTARRPINRTIATVARFLVRSLCNPNFLCICRLLKISNIPVLYLIVSNNENVLSCIHTVCYSN